MGSFLKNFGNNSTIFAFSSGSVPSGVGIIRISGPLSLKCAKIITGDEPKKPRIVELKNFVNPNTNDYIDRGLMIWFNKPNSFTGEDIIEFHTHGSMAVVDLLYEILLSIDNVRIAEPGEFTRRSFENNKLNLEQVEGLVDVINAETKIQLDHANKLLLGNLGELTENLRVKLLALLSEIEAAIEFEDDGIVLDTFKNLNLKIDSISEIINDILVNYQNSQIIRDGLIISIIGPPNVGKSSIINRLTNSDVSIITNIPGTTRDIVEVKLKLFGYPVLLRDTAGLRHAQDVVEKIGVEKSIESIKQSDLIISVTDNELDLPIDLNIYNITDNTSIIEVQNKSDLIRDFNKNDTIYISAKTNFGFEKLLSHIKIILESKFNQTKNKMHLISRKRHHEIFQEISNSLISFKKQTELELKAEDLRFGIQSLGKITGRVDVEDMLDKLFNEFCIGK